MRRFRKWLLERFLPTWAKESVYKENAALQKRIDEQRREIERLNAYINGLEAGIRAQRRIVINAAEGGKKS